MSNEIYGFLVEKYGKWGLTKKERVLIFSQESVSYYPVPEDKEFYQKLVDFKTKIKNSDPKNIQELLQDANLTADKNKFSLDKPKGSIPLNSFDKEDNNAVDKIIWIDNNDKGDTKKLKDENKRWEILMNSNEVELIKKIRVELNNKKNKEAPENKGPKKAEENQNNKTTSQNNQFTNYRFLTSLEKIYQILWDEYYKEKINSSKKPGKLAELELSIK